MHRNYLKDTCNKLVVNSAALLLCVLTMFAMMAISASAYSPAEGAWMPNAAEANLTGEAKDVFEKGCEKLIKYEPIIPGGPSEKINDITAVAFFATSKSAGATDYAFICLEDPDSRQDFPRVFKMINMHKDESTGEVTITRNENLVIKNYFEDTTGVALGGFNEDWQIAENPMGSPIPQQYGWNGFESVLEKITDYEIKPICRLAYQYHNLTVTPINGTPDNREPRAILCYTKEKTSGNSAIQILFAKMEKTNGADAELIKFSKVIENIAEGTGVKPDVQPAPQQENLIGKTFVYAKNKYKITANPKNNGTGQVALIKAKNAKKVSLPKTVKFKGKVYKVTELRGKAFTAKKIRSVTVGANVKKISKNAFKKSKATTIVLKTKKLSRASIKGALKGSKVKTVKVKVGSKKTNKKYVRKYKKFFTKKVAGRKVAVK